MSEETVDAVEDAQDVTEAEVKAEAEVEAPKKPRPVFAANMRREAKAAAKERAK